MLLDASTFNECLQKDEKLAFHICSELSNHFDIECDLLFISNEFVSEDKDDVDDDEEEDEEEEEEEVLTGYLADGNPRQCSARAIQGSLTYLALTELRNGDNATSVNNIYS